MDMKNSRLSRKTPLRRGASTLKRTPLKRGKPLAQQSKVKLKWKAQYDLIIKEFRKRGCAKEAMNGKVYALDRLEPHHVCGRKRHYLLIFCWLLKEVHREIHDRGIAAREEGWLQPEFSGRALQGRRLRPWQKGTLINEEMLGE